MGPVAAGWSLWGHRAGLRRTTAKCPPFVGREGARHGRTAVTGGFTATGRRLTDDGKPTTTGPERMRSSIAKIVAHEPPGHTYSSPTGRLCCRSRTEHRPEAPAVPAPFPAAHNAAQGQCKRLGLVQRDTAGEPRGCFPGSGLP